jgi:hypothetical protein
MKIIITEEQYDRVINRNAQLWIKRRFSLIEKELKICAMNHTEDDICRYDTYEKFEHYFFSVFMDCLHPYFYADEIFEYEGVFNELKDLFYVECTEFYFAGRKRC